MEGDYTLEEKLGELRSVGSFVARDQMTHLCETVDKDKEGVIAVGFWEVDDEVAGDTFSRGIGDRNQR